MEATNDDWVVCGRCQALIYKRRMIRAGRVCPECSWHGQLTADERLEQLLDPDSIRSLDLWVPDHDPLNFADLVPYAERLRKARATTGMEEAVICARGTVDGNLVIVAAMDFRFMGGSLSGAVGELITQAAETALRERTPLIIVSASGGARMQEGAVSLMQMAKTSQALGELDEAGILTVSLVTDPTFGGVAASYSTLCDVIITEPGARLGFAGARVIEQTIGEKLPEGFQTAEFLLEHGMLDAVHARSSLRRVLARLVSIGSRVPDREAVEVLRPESSAAKREVHFGSRGEPENPVVRDYTTLPEREAWDVVRRARELQRPTALDYFHRMLTDFEELHGDRLEADSPSIVGGVGRLEGVPVVVIGTQKGHTSAELTSRNFGMPSPSGYRKAARLMRMAAKLGLPLVTLIDTPGAYPGIEAEEKGQAVAIAENLRLMSRMPVPIVSVVTGEGGSGGALALAVANQVLICENAAYSVISPEGCAAILWKDGTRAPDAARAMRVDPRELLRLGIVDGVIPEPLGGMEGDHHDSAVRLSSALVAALEELTAKDPVQLIRERRARFRKFGATVTAETAMAAGEGG